MTFDKLGFEDFENSISKRGYFKYYQIHQNSDYQWFKSYKDEEGTLLYQIALLVYDISKYERAKDVEKPISVSLSFMLGNVLIDGRCDLIMSRQEYTVTEFEEFCAKFYKFLKVEL